MMRRSCTWIVMVAFLLALAAPALAQQTTAPAAPAAPAQKAPAKSEPAKSDVKKTKSATGTVKSATPDSVVLAGKDKKEHTFAIDKDTKITKAGKTATAADIAPEDSATVRYTEADGKMKATSVSVKGKTAAAAKPKS